MAFIIAGLNEVIPSKYFLFYKCRKVLCNAITADMIPCRIVKKKHTLYCIFL